MNTSSKPGRASSAPASVNRQTILMEGRSDAEPTASDGTPLDEVLSAGISLVMARLGIDQQKPINGTGGQN